MPGLHGYSTVEEILPQLLAALEEAGADYIEASYSGGNDEGGIDDVMIFRRFEENGEEQKVEIAHDGRWGDPVYDLCNEIMSSKYYTWAGEFYASGMLYVDARTKSAWTEGGEQVEMPNPDYDEINVSL